MLLPFQIVEEVVSPGTCSSSVEHEINVKIIISKYEYFVHYYLELVREFKLSF